MATGNDSRTKAENEQEARLHHALKLDGQG
jgi:hypothetical protein